MTRRKGRGDIPFVRRPGFPDCTERWGAAQTPAHVARGDGAHRGGSCIEKGGGGVQTPPPHPPPPCTPPFECKRARKGEGADSRVGRRVGWFDALALFTCCFTLFLFVCIHFITVTKKKKKRKSKKRSFKISAQDRPGAWNRCEMVRASAVSVSLSFLP